MSVPDLFRCPISLDIFADPVTLSTGQTYDRPNIEKWLADGNLTCPVTMQRLDDMSLVPNHTLRLLIDQWLITRTAENSTEPIESSLSALKHNLQSSSTALVIKLESLRKVRILSVESEIGQACLIQLGFFPLLLRMLLQSPIVNSEIVELALDCILSLSLSSQLNSLNIVTKDSNLARLVLLLDQGNAKIKTKVCHLIELIATSSVTKEVCLAMGRSRRVLQVLVSLLHENNDAAVRAISAMCSLEANREFVIIEGGIGGLIAYLSKRNSLQALATIEILQVLEIGKKALVKHSNAIGVLVKTVFRVSSHQEGSEHAIGLLMGMCCSSARARAEAVNAGLVTQLLLLIQSQCSVECKAKAITLLKLLRSMWTREDWKRGSV